MSTAKERAEGVALWVRDSTAEAIVERISDAEEQAFLWHIVSIQMDASQREAIKNIGAALRAGGYDPKGG